MADPSNRPRCVFDCVVLLQAVVSRRGPAFALLTLVESGRLELLICREGIAELRDVLLRPAVRQKFPMLTAELADDFLLHLEKIATMIDSVPPLFQLARDPDDEVYLNLALAGKAQYLVTRDRDLLDLARETSSEGRALRQDYPDLKVVGPIALLRELAGV